MFSGVCRWWRYVARRHPPLTLPWVLTPAATLVLNKTAVYCVVCDNYHPAFAFRTTPSAPASAASSGGVGSPPPRSPTRPTLFNLCTGDRFVLPLSLCGGAGFCQRMERVQYKYIGPIHAVILSAVPPLPQFYKKQSFYAAAILGREPNIAFWSPGMSHWMPPIHKMNKEEEDWYRMVPEDPIEDVTYCAGGNIPVGDSFYVLTNKEVLVVYTPNTDDDDDDLTMSSVECYCEDEQPTMAGPDYVLARYLVQSCGELFMFIRGVSTKDGRTAWFNILRLEQQSSGSWSWKPLIVPFSDLSGQKIFLSRGCSFAVADSWSPCPPYIIVRDAAPTFHADGSNPFPWGCCCSIDVQHQRSFPQWLHQSHWGPGWCVWMEGFGFGNPIIRGV
uniref:KIB1-4 beta-propeller domain-containing protein n=1 Tax=Leersia perrieri TaxID=77586 RepID=A0A0D9X0G3_9ORYZ